MTFTKILVAASIASALTLGACAKKEEAVNNVTETTNVVEVAPADANAVPADANAADANAVTNAVAP